MRVVWAPEAEHDRDDIWDTIAADVPLVAVRLDRSFTDRGEAGGTILGTRERIPA